MFDAQLKGKFTREEEDLEDLLTSNVFGAIKYVTYKEGLIPLLSEAERLDGNKPLQGLKDISKVEYQFWPFLEEEGCNPCEPDVLISITQSNGKQILILVEAKFKSGKSSEADLSDKPSDQLSKEWDNLIRHAKRKNSEPYLLYITADIGFPEKEINESISDYFFKKPGSTIDILWLSWRKLPAIFHNSENEIIKDLVRLLRRQGLIFFEGFKISQVEDFNWQFQAGNVGYPVSQPLVITWSFRPIDIKWKFEKLSIIHFNWNSFFPIEIKWRISK
jgi:hypothetical protein